MYSIYYIDDNIVDISKNLNEIDYLFFMLTNKYFYNKLNNYYLFDHTEHWSNKIKLKNVCHYGLDYIKLIESENFPITLGIAQNVKSLEQLKYFESVYDLNGAKLHISGNYEFLNKIRGVNGYSLIPYTNKSTIYKLIKIADSTTTPLKSVSNSCIKYFEKINKLNDCINFIYDRINLYSTNIFKYNIKHIYKFINYAIEQYKHDNDLSKYTNTLIKICKISPYYTSKYFIKNNMDYSIISNYVPLTQNYLSYSTSFNSINKYLTCTDIYKNFDKKINKYYICCDKTYCKYMGNVQLFGCSVYRNRNNYNNEYYTKHKKYIHKRFTDKLNNILYKFINIDNVPIDDMIKYKNYELLKYRIDKNKNILDMDALYNLSDINIIEYLSTLYTINFKLFKEYHIQLLRNSICIHTNRPNIIKENKYRFKKYMDIIIKNDIILSSVFFKHTPLYLQKILITTDYKYYNFNTLLEALDNIEIFKLLYNKMISNNLYILGYYAIEKLLSYNISNINEFIYKQDIYKNLCLYTNQNNEGIHTLDIIKSENDSYEDFMNNYMGELYKI